MTNPAVLTLHECILIRHAIGISDDGQRLFDTDASRNHFSVPDDSENYVIWSSLVERGLARSSRPVTASGDAMRVFQVTEAGKQAQRCFGMKDGLGNPISAAGVYYIQDTRAQVGLCALFWGRPKDGFVCDRYVCDLDEAGIYRGFDVARMRDTDIAWPVEHVLKHAIRHVPVGGLAQTKQHDRQRALTKMLTDTPAQTK